MTVRSEQAIVGIGLLYLAVLGWSMANMSYDIWGALVLVPMYGVLGTIAMRSIFRGELDSVARVMCWGLLLKLGGALSRYWVGFEAYEGGIDAQRYHEYALGPAGRVWSGDQSIFDVVPSGTGTEFVERFTAFVYTLTGSSQLGGFITFAFLGYVGVAYFLKAALVAVPGLAARKLAWLVVLAPSLVYWPSSIGKEAPVILGLGLGTYGIALMLARRSWFWALALTGVGLGFAGLIRPHMAGIWLAGALPALLLAFVLGGRSKAITGHSRRRSRLAVIVVVALAAVALSGVGAITVRYLEPEASETGGGSGSITDILAETQRRSAKTGSTYDPPPIASPTQWPFAVVRTLTRPLPLEARGIAQLFSAAELVALGGIYAGSWRRLRNFPRMLLTNPYVAFSITTLFLTGLAFSSFANLGILTRQKSLLFPFLLLLPCLPTRARRAPTDPFDAVLVPDEQALLDDDADDGTPSREPVPAGARYFTQRELDEFWD